MAVVSSVPYYNLLFVQKQLTNTQIGIMFAVRNWFGVPASIFWGWLADFFHNHQLVFVLSILASVASTVAVLYGQGFTMMLLLFVLNHAVMQPVTIMADAIIMSQANTVRG